MVDKGKDREKMIYSKRNKQKYLIYLHFIFMIKNITKYTLVTLATLFGITATYLSSKAFGTGTLANEFQNNGFIDKAYADIPTNTSIDPGCSGSGCSGGASV